MSDDSLTFDDLQRVLVQLHALTDAAEAHGTLVGALCTSECSLADWLGQILPDGRAEATAAMHLRAIFESTCGSLGEHMLSFAPLLPPDDASISDRTAALGEWCQGFLYGLGSGARPEASALQGDAAEVVRDFTHITQVDVDPDEDEEQNEQAYAELVEFVRVGVQLVYEQLTPLREPPVESGEVLH
ncbi:MAG: UPF0149 family protein [Nevskiaceae bacterium]|jgi:uncharacterized protein YgfB (UPF0149 family)|nr:UPF0149 family protein [Nevskiaceae bacterium]